MRAAEAQSASSRALLQELRLQQADRERRSDADLAAARDRLREATLTANWTALTGASELEAAKAEAEAAGATLRDLERGSLPEEIARAQADLKAAEAALTFARSEAVRYETLERRRGLAARPGARAAGVRPGAVGARCAGGGFGTHKARQRGKTRYKRPAPGSAKHKRRSDRRRRIWRARRSTHGSAMRPAQPFGRPKRRQRGSAKQAAHEILQR